MSKEKTKEKKKFSWLKLTVKIVLVIGALFALSLVMLSKLGGNSEKLKQMVEDFASDASGYDVTLGQLENLTFFPTIGVQFDQMQFANKSNQTTIAAIDKLSIKMSFWSAVFSTGKIKDLNISGLSVKPGVVTQEALKITRLGIEDPAHDDESVNVPAQLLLNGMLGDKAFAASSTIAASGVGQTREYDMGKERKITASLGDLSLSALMKNTSFARIDLSEINLKKAKETLLSGDMNVELGTNTRVIKGTLSIGKGSIIKPDVSIANTAIKGTIQSPKMNVEDMGALAGALAALGDIAPKKKNADTGKISLPEQNVDLTLKLDDIYLGGEEMGAQIIPIRIKDKALSISADQGSFAGAKTDIKITLVPSDDDNIYRLNSLVKMDELSMQKLLKNLGKKMDIHVPLDTYLSVGASLQKWSDLPSKLKGRLIVTSENAEFSSQLLSVWGDGLASLLLPSLKPSDEAKFACGVLDVPLSGGLATVQTLYIEGTHVLVNGSGTYDMVQDRLKLRLKPKTRDISIGDLSTAIKITGPISKPSVGADAIDMGKKAAGLLLGTLNPALMALATTDVGLSNDNKALCASVGALTGANKAEAYSKIDQSAQ